MEHVKLVIKVVASILEVFHLDACPLAKPDDWRDSLEVNHDVAIALFNLLLLDLTVLRVGHVEEGDHMLLHFKVAVSLAYHYFNFMTLVDLIFYGDRLFCAFAEFELLWA